MAVRWCVDCASVRGLWAVHLARGKFLAWTELLDQLNLRGDEHILDLGCGRGAVLLLAAQRLTTGRAVGVDVWRRGDQSGNAAMATRRNALAEGVADRIALHTADMTALPFEADSFDLVVSNVAMHNVKLRAGRKKAIAEAVRRVTSRGTSADRRSHVHTPVPKLPHKARDARGFPPEPGVANVVERTLARNASRNRNEAHPTVDANLNVCRMRRTLPWTAGLPGRTSKSFGPRRSNDSEVVVTDAR